MAPTFGGGPTPSAVPEPRSGQRDDLVYETYDVVGYRASIGATAGKGLDAVRALLDGFGAPAPGLADGARRYDLIATMGGWHVHIEGEMIHTSKDFTPAISTLEFRLVTDALMQRDDLFRMHAAALCLPMQPAGVVVAADSGRGKTTLTLGLMLRGFVPFSDDVALIDPDTLTLRPFRRAFHVDPKSWALLQPLAGRAITVDERVDGYYSPPQWAEHPVPVRAILFPVFEPEAPSSLVPLTTPDAATAILAHTSSLTHAPQRALATAARLVDRVRCYRFSVGDVSSSVAAIERLSV
jgi:hypothetical protein